MEIIKEKLAQIKIFTGLNLIPCDFFTGVFEWNGKSLFYVEISQPVFASNEYIILSRISGNGIISSVEPAGNKRLAIIF